MKRKRLGASERNLHPNGSQNRQNESLKLRDGMWRNFCRSTGRALACSVEVEMGYACGGSPSGFGIVSLHPGLFLLVVFGACCLAICAEIPLGRYRSRT